MQVMHSDERFEFTVNGPYERVFPLFGAWGERAWAEGWNPRFIWPHPAADRPGMVFTQDNEGQAATWVNTEFDSESGRVQYVYVLPEVLATVVTLRVERLGEGTHVRVRYERTALAAQAEARVQRMARSDRDAGSEWASAIQAYLDRD